MSAEIVMIVEDENTCLRPRDFPVEVRRGEPADSTTDDNEIIRLSRCYRFASRVPESTVAQSMGRVKRTRMASTQSGKRRRIVISRILLSPDSKAHSCEGSIAAPAVIATPFKKSRRVMRRCMPNSRSRKFCKKDPRQTRAGSSSRLVNNYMPRNCDGVLAKASNYVGLSVFFTADSAPWNPILLCVPSQKGLFTDPPQRHKEIPGLPVKSNLLPSAL